MTNHLDWRNGFFIKNHGHDGSEDFLRCSRLARDHHQSPFDHLEDDEDGTVARGCQAEPLP